MLKKDSFNRGPYIKFIENLIVNSNHFKRNEEYNSYIIAIDSAWGTGKTHFIELLIDDIKQNCPNISTVKYNAWENDYSEDPFAPLFYEILKSDCLKSDVDIGNAEKLFKTSLTMVRNFAKGILKNYAKEKLFLPDELIEDLKEYGNNAKELLLHRIPELCQLDEHKQALEDFKKIISEYTMPLKQKDGKLVVIIDELDRCKPTFSIQTLEVAKHIFDIENVVFLFAVDIQQLSHSISCVYGQGYDSVGYLCRFFDYIAKLPTPDVEEYIKNKIKETPDVPQEKTNSHYKSYPEEDFYIPISRFLKEVYDALNMSLRDIDTIIQSYGIMLKNFLGEYKMVGAHFIYIFYLSLKYKKPDLYNDIFVNKVSYVEKVSPILRTIITRNFLSNPWLESSEDMFYTDKSFSDIIFSLNCDSEGKKSHIKGKIKRLDENDYLLYIIQSQSHFTNSDKTLHGNYYSANNVLFYPDLKGWEEISNLKYKEFLHRKLEMYSFVNLEIEEKELQII